MNLLPYELFASVARTLNISKTAQQYYISQPAVSHHLKSLEQSLGVELIKRTKRGVVLTAAGSEYLPYIQEILAINERANNHVRNVAGGMTGRVSIAALSSATTPLSDSLVRLYAEHPFIQADVSLLEGQELTEALRKNSHDFYFAVSPMIPFGMGYERLTVDRGSMALFVNRSIAGEIDLDDWSTVSRHPFVSVPKADVSLYSRVMSICRKRGFTPHIVNIYNRAEAVVLSVNSGLGAAILPETLGRLYQRPDVVTMPISGEDAVAETVFIWSPDRLSASGVIFRDTVLGLYGEGGPEN